MSHAGTVGASPDRATQTRDHDVAHVAPGNLTTGARTRVLNRRLSSAASRRGSADRCVVVGGEAAGTAEARLCGDRCGDVAGGSIRGLACRAGATRAVPRRRWPKGVVCRCRRSRAARPVRWCLRRPLDEAPARRCRFATRALCARARPIGEPVAVRGKLLRVQQADRPERLPPADRVNRPSRGMTTQNFTLNARRCGSARPVRRQEEPPASGALSESLEGT